MSDQFEIGDSKFMPERQLFTVRTKL